MRNSGCHSPEAMVRKKKNVHFSPEASVLKLIYHWSDFAYLSGLSFSIKLYLTFVGMSATIGL